MLLLSDGALWRGAGALNHIAGYRAPCPAHRVMMVHGLTWNKVPHRCYGTLKRPARAICAYEPMNSPENDTTLSPVENPPARQLRLALARARLQMRVVGEIGQAREILYGDVDALARIITERAALTVGCERVNVWLFDDTESTLRCVDDYTASKRLHSSGATLTEAQYRHEFHALKNSRYVAADDPLNDPRTRGYTDTYLKPLGITSMLDTVIQISGKNLGLLCFEHVGPQHRWQSDEIAFAEQLADKLGLALRSRARRHAEAELRASEEKFRGLVESSQDFIWELDEDFRYTYAGPQSERLFGYAPEDLLGRCAFDFMPATEAARVRTLVTSDAMRHRSFTALVNTVVHKDGHEIILESSAVPKFDRDGNFRGYSGIDHDVTERRRSEERLLLANTLLSSEIESAPDGVVVIDTRTGDMSWNEKFQRMWRLSEAVVRLASPDAVLAEIAPQIADAASFRDAVAKFRADPTIALHRELDLVDGRTIEWHTGSLRTVSGESIGRVNYMRDVTDRKRAVEEAREARQLLESILNSIPVRVFWKDRNLNFRGCNAPFARDAGFQEPSQLVGKSDFDMGWRDHAELYRADDRQVIETGKPRALIEEPQTLPDGSVVTLLTSKIPLRDAAGKIEGVLGIYMDISERKRAEEQVRRSAAELQEAQRVAQLGSWVWYPETDEQEFSPELCRIFGLDPAMPPPPLKHFEKVLMPESYAALMEAATRAHTDGTPYALDVQFRRANRAPGWLLVRGEADIGQDGVCKRLRGTALDITERKEAEEALAYRDRVLHSVMDSTVAFVAADSMTQPLDGTLKGVANALGLDRLMVMRMPGSSGGEAQLVQAWQVADVPPVTDDILRSFARLTDAELAHLAARRILFMTRNAAAGVTRALLLQLQTRSEMVVPIIVSGAYWGHLVADDCRSERLWSSAEIDALRTLAEIIGLLMYREQVRFSLRQSEERFRAVSETAQDAIIMINGHGRIVYWNRAAESILGYTREEAVGLGVHEIMAWESDRARADKELRKFAETGEGRILEGVRELTARRKDGGEVPVELSVSAIRLHSEWHAVAFMRDISERKRSQSVIQHMALHDVLTGLSNRRVFVSALEESLGRARRGGGKFAVLYLDLDHFKDINDTLGHPVGDLVLKEVAARLLAIARETDTVARFGGDEFAVLQAGFSDPADSAAFAERILTALTAPMLLDGNEIRTGTSVGISVCDDASDAEKLLSQADVALYRAKSEGRGTFRFFTESMDQDVHRRVRLGAELRQALAANQLFLEYQPQVDVSTGRIVGVEALTRWRHPERGLVSPAEFIPVAEQTGLIVAIGQWALREACMQARMWLDSGIAVPLLAINLSGLQFKSAHELESHIAAVLATTGLQPPMLELELTESILLDASKEHNDVLLRLRANGFRLAIDDFGTGYSSLEYLRRFPVDRIKIAQNFIAELTTNSGDAAIVKAALSLAREMHLPAIVEGVETAEQLKLLRGWGCSEVQGYYYARPLPPDEAAALLSQGVIVRND
jgi:diguanylate cyclase (GGDEF)-like protein/PAS domain S-box-containing protein